jgi:alkanesulfonate monooxygenase SsuD/methylene tetrahydromethanopterin reductase-like flavin-dependent oxidoreductase (luciferase family)
MSDSSPETKRGFGVAALISHDVIREAARLAEEMGYDSFWVNDNDAGDGLVALAEAAKVTNRIKLGVGVIALTRRTPANVIEKVKRLELPQDRLYLGLGSGVGKQGALARVRDGVAALREALEAPIFISALGPKMSHLAGEIADGVLFNWLTIEQARQSADIVRQGAASAGRDTPILATYVRIAIDDGGFEFLASEAARYGSNPAYAANFKRMGVRGEQTAIATTNLDEVATGLEAWNGVLDHIVARAITGNNTLEQTTAIVRAAAPR